MSHSFRLYDQLEKKYRENKRTSEDFEKLAYHLEKIDEKSQKICLALILEYFYRQTKTKTLQERALPFKGKTILKNSGAKFRVQNLPDKLREILIMFLEESSGAKFSSS